MSQVSVRKAEGNSRASQSILESLNGISDSIRDRAFQLFQSRGGGDPGASGGELDDWLQAERELFSIPSSELSESDREYRIEVAVAGFDSKDLDVTAQGNRIVVRGDAGSNRGENSKPLLRRFDLPASIDAGAVTAKLDNGLLTITAAKSASKSSAAKA